MNTYKIKKKGTFAGAYEGRTHTEALNKFAADLNYSDYEELSRRDPDLSSSLQIWKAKKKGFWAIFFMLLLCIIATGARASLTSESEGELTFSVTLPEGATAVQTYSSHIEAGSTINYSGGSINTPDDTVSYKGQFEQDFDISGDTYYSRSVAEDGELSTIARAVNGPEQWAYALSMIWFNVTPNGDYEIDFEGEFNGYIELDSNNPEATAFSTAAYSVWLGTVQQYEGDSFDNFYLEDEVIWHQIDGADSYDDDTKDKFKHKDYDLAELGQAEEYVLLFIVDSYSHVDADPPIEAQGFGSRMLSHKEHLPTINEIRSKEKGCFISEALSCD